MKSNSARASVLVAVAVSAAGAVVAAALRPALTRGFHELRVTSDVYALPPPRQARTASLGYRAALADLIFAHVLVSYGLHIQEKRRFEFVGDYLDTINALDPEFRDPYRFADTLLTLQGVKPRVRDYRRARTILERGLDELPYDAELWRNAGQFMAYLAWSRLPEDEQQEWRSTGAKYLARACELVGNDGTLQYHCIAAASLFNKLGEHEAMIEFLERVQIITDDPEIRKMARGYLKVHLAARDQEQAAGRAKRFHEAWGGDFTFLTRNGLLALGPGFDPALCAGRGARSRAECATSWRDWHDRRERSRR